MQYFKKIVKESIIVVVITTVISMLSGSVMALTQDVLRSMPLVFLLLPALNDLIGDISTIFISRLTTKLYLGELNSTYQISKKLIHEAQALLISLFMCIFVLIIGGIIYEVAHLRTIISLGKIIISIGMTGLLTFFFMNIILFLWAIYLFKKGKDPNNVLVPIITSALDFLTPLLIVLFLMIFS